MLGLTRRELGQGRTDRAVLGVGHRRAVAERPDVRVPRDAQIVLGLDPSPFERQPGGHDQGDRRGADRADDGAARDLRAVPQADAELGDGCHGRAESHLDAPRPHLPRGVVAKFHGQLRQDPVAAVQQDHADFVGAEGTKVRPARRQQVMELSRHLDPAEPAADDDEGQQGPSPFRIRLDLGTFELAGDVVAQQQGISQPLQREAMRGQAGHQVEMTRRSAGQHEVVVWLGERSAP